MNIQRKAEIFDRLINGIDGRFPDDELYALLRDTCRMNDSEIKESGIRFTGGERNGEISSLEILAGADVFLGGTVSKPIKLKDLLKDPLPNDTYLVHSLYDVGFLPVGRLSIEDLSSEDQEKWSDVLNAEVCRVFPGAYGMHIEVDGVEPERLSNFSYNAAPSQMREPRMGL
jgi:hypothetical protein